jgi:hypothetical protein
VDGSAVHAVIVIGSVVVPDDLAANYHRVDGKPSTLRMRYEYAFTLITTNAVNMTTNQPARRAIPRAPPRAPYNFIFVQ